MWFSHYVVLLIYDVAPSLCGLILYAVVPSLCAYFGMSILVARQDTLCLIQILSTCTSLHLQLFRFNENLMLKHFLILNI